MASAANTAAVWASIFNDSAYFYSPFAFSRQATVVQVWLSKPQAIAGSIFREHK
jgi:hypothetical protein